MKLRDAIEALSTPDHLVDEDIEEAMDMEVFFMTGVGVELELLSVYEHEGAIYVDIGDAQDG